SSNPEIKGIGIYQSATRPTVSASPGENTMRRITMFQRVLDTNAMIFYYEPVQVNYNWNGTAWETPSWVFWGNMSIDTYYIYELISDGTNW
ncbi:MAG: hypothetical protein GWN30_03195, partial [Gammaproteobacteria bacterium]|nr:hypothetical protein [Gammaproteobacteria bacterium]